MPCGINPDTPTPCQQLEEVQLTAEEFANLRSQIATSSLDGAGAGHGGRHYLPRVFTEHGALMAATVLSSPRAVEVSIYVVRAFVQLRELANTHQGQAKRLDALEEKTEALAMSHDTFSRNAQPASAEFFFISIASRSRATT